MVFEYKEFPMSNDVDGATCVLHFFYLLYKNTDPYIFLNEYRKKYIPTLNFNNKEFKDLKLISRKNVFNFDLFNKNFISDDVMKFFKNYISDEDCVYYTLTNGDNFFGNEN